MLMKEKILARKFNTAGIIRQIPLICFLAVLLFPAGLFADTLDCTGNPDCTISGTVNITAIVGNGSTTTTGTTGGTGGGGGAPPTSVTFSGWAYPFSQVTLLEDGQQIADINADTNAVFTISIPNLAAGTYTFSILSTDSKGLRSTLFTIPLSITAGVSTTVSGIFLAPTIELNMQEIIKGDTLAIVGETVPDSIVDIEISADPVIDEQVSADVNGDYSYDFSTAPLDYGDYSVKAKATFIADQSHTSSYSKVAAFTVGTTTIEKIGNCPAKGDLNNDCRVNLVDFSIMAYWYGRPNPPANIDLNGDGQITLADFSIMAYYWTG